MKGDRPIAIVTGASRTGRVGLAIAAELARAGCDLVLTARDAASVPKVGLPEALGGVTVRWEAVDLDDPERAEELGKTLARQLPRCDVLVHNASVYEPTPLESLGVEDGLRHYRVNALSPLMLSAALAGALGRSAIPGGGAIVAMCDIHAMGELGQARRDFAAYGMSKAALLEMVMVLARALAPRVRVNAVAPGVVAFATSGHESDEAMQRAYLRRVPLERAGTPEDAARAVRWLALEAAYCTGQVVRVDGGRAIT
ncbi:MAG: SDR family oxidoreductase [Phycisphaerae bacterium]|nr:SDR family oxidoreductase [Phycisphaerae bacterium]